jgi:hypothetical protein
MCLQKDTTGKCKLVDSRGRIGIGVCYMEGSNFLCKCNPRITTSFIDYIQYLHNTIYLVFNNIEKTSLSETVVNTKRNKKSNIDLGLYNIKINWVIHLVI